MNRLSVDNLSYFAGSKQLLFDLSCEIKQGEIVACLGPNGAGKTTLLRSIIGLCKNYPADTIHKKNCITFNATLLNSLSVSDRVILGISYLAQQSSLFTQMSVDENLSLVYLYHDSWQKKSKTLFNETIDYWLDQTHLTETRAQKTATLSGGQKRKLEIVRTLLMSPLLLLLDEPFAGIDPKSIYELKKIFVELAQNGMGIFISDHHVDHLFSIAQRGYVIINGSQVTAGTIQDILNNKATREMYLGQEFGNKKQ